MFRLIIIFELNSETEIVDALASIQRQLADSSLIIHGETGADPDRMRLSILADFQTAADADTWIHGKEKRNIDYELGDPKETFLCYYRNE